MDQECHYWVFRSLLQAFCLQPVLTNVAIAPLIALTLVIGPLLELPIMALVAQRLLRLRP